MRWLYRAQQRLALTRQEGAAILTLAFLLLVGLVARYVQQQPAPLPERTRAAYARADSLLAAGAARPLQEDGRLQGESAEAAATPPATTSARQQQDAAPPSSAAPQTRGGRLNLNTASAAELEALPRIGPTLAQRVLDYRSTHGPFRSVDELRRVHGIGEKTVAGVAPHVFVEAPPPQQQP